MHAVRRRRIQNQPDHAGADGVPAQEPADRLDRAPTNTQESRRASSNFLTADGLFKGPVTGFFEALKQLAAEADSAKPTG